MHRYPTETAQIPEPSHRVPTQTWMMRKTLLAASVLFLAYWLTLATIGGVSNICFYSGPDPDNQPFLAYGFPFDPTYATYFDLAFAPITAGFDKTKISRDPGDFSGESGRRLGLFTVLLCISTNYGRLLIAILSCCTTVVLYRSSQFAIRWSASRHVNPDGE